MQNAEGSDKSIGVWPMGWSNRKGILAEVEFRLGLELNRHRERHIRMGKHYSKAQIGEYMVEGGPGTAVTMDLWTLQLAGTY